MKNMKKCIVFLFSLLVLVTSLSASGPKVDYDHPGVTARDLASPIPNPNVKKVKWVTVEEIEKSLKGKPPMVVSFDVDDTIFFSSAIFYYGKNKFSPDSYKYLKNQKYWNFVSDAADKYSLPKQSARALIEMHQRRGDQIIFITGRTGPRGYKWNKLDKCAKIIRDTFNIKNMQPIYYRDMRYKGKTKYDKTYHIKRMKSQLHYGDSNDDILAAKEAGIRGIRVMRPAMSNHEPHPLNGGYGEEVVANSSY